MNFGGFQWDAGNWIKCQSHGLSMEEIESLFAREVLVVDDIRNSGVERRFRAIGLTEKGRHAFVVFTMRGDLIRPLSARYMHRKEIKRYEEDNSDV